MHRKGYLYASGYKHIYRHRHNSMFVYKSIYIYIYKIKHDTSMKIANSGNIPSRPVASTRNFDARLRYPSSCRASKSFATVGTFHIVSELFWYDKKKHYTIILSFLISLANFHLLELISETMNVAKTPPSLHSTCVSKYRAGVQDFR